MGANHGFQTKPADLALWFSNPDDQNLRWACAESHKGKVSKIRARQTDFIIIEKKPLPLTRLKASAWEEHEKERKDYVKFSEYHQQTKEQQKRRKKRQRELAAVNSGYADWLARGGADRSGTMHSID